MNEITLCESPPLRPRDLRTLLECAWPDRRQRRDPCRRLSHSLAYVCAFDGKRLIGFVNIAWDGAEHGFILDTTVHPAIRRQGVGTRLVRRAAEVARREGLTWLHVDFVPALAAFHERAGFQPTAAGLLRLR